MSTEPRCCYPSCGKPEDHAIHQAPPEGQSIGKRHAFRRPYHVRTTAMPTDDKAQAEKQGLSIRVEMCAVTHEAEYIATQRRDGWLLYERTLVGHVCCTSIQPTVRLVWWRS